MAAVSMRERVSRYQESPITWIRVIVAGTLLWAFMILVRGQLPSVIVYKVDQYIAQIITSWLFFAFIAVWAGVGLYLFSLSRRQRDLERRLKDLEPGS